MISWAMWAALCSPTRITSTWGCVSTWARASVSTRIGSTRYKAYLIRLRGGGFRYIISLPLSPHFSKEIPMKDFFLFRRMVTPYIIMIIFWLAVIVLILSMLAFTIQT